MLAAVLLASCQERREQSTVVQSEPADHGGDTTLAPEFALPNLKGETVRLSDFRGQVVIVDFWATWCGPCRMEIPHLKELVRKYGDKGFNVIGVSMDDAGAEVVRPFVRQLEISYPVLIGDAYTARRYGGVNALPTTFLIDRQGRVVKKYIGYRDLGSFEEDLGPLF